MSELTPEQYQAQQHALNDLRALRHEGETFISRRDRAIYAAHMLGLSLRQVGREIGLSPQGVSNIVERVKDIEESLK